MRTIGLLAITIAVLAASEPSRALEASDTMTSWRGAGVAKKTKIVDEVLKANGREGGASAVVKCVDAASEFSGHADLKIRIVVEACAKQSGEPV